MASKAENLMSRFGGTIGQAVGARPLGLAPVVDTSPDKYADAVKARSFAEMPVDAIHADPQVREAFDGDELARLAASIKRFGQLAPIRVRHDAERGRWVVLVGERRLRACRLAGLEKIRVEFVDRPMSEADMLAEQVVENVARADLAPVEKAHAYRRLMDMNGWTALELADTLGVEPTGVYRVLAMLKLPDDVAAKVDAGTIGMTAAYELSKLESVDEQREASRLIETEGLDFKGTVEEVKRRRAAGSSANRRRTKPKLRPPVDDRPRRMSNGVKVRVEASPKHTLDDVRAALRELLDRLDGEASQEAA